MADLHRTPDGETAPIESRRAGLAQADPGQPAAPDTESPASLEQLELGDFAAESARPTPLDDIAEAEREQLPRD